MKRRLALALVVALSGAAALGLGRASAHPSRGSSALGVGLVSSAIRDFAPVLQSLEERSAAERQQRELENRLKSRIREMPDLTQTDPGLGVVGGGESWCGPVAVSNALMWLGEHGRETLIPSGADAHERQLELVRRLGSNRYMGTTPNGGTGTSNLLNGLHSYLRDTGWGEKRLAYAGWRGHPVRFTSGEKIASFEFIRSGFGQGGVVMIHAGWYHPSPYGDFYRRNGGHWLTVVGVGIDERGNDAPDALVLNDPAPYAGDQPAHSFVSLTRLESGWLLAEDGAFPAKGYAKLGGGMKIKREGELAVLDGAVLLVP